MWRRFGDDLLAIIFVLLFSLLAFAVAALIGAVVLDLIDELALGRLGALVAGGAAITGLALLLVAANVLGYRVISTRLERGRGRRLEMWTERWVGVVVQGEPPPPGPLPMEAQEALLDLREPLVGAEGERVEGLVRRFGIGEELVRRSRDRTRRGPARLLGRRRHRLAYRLAALEALAKVRLSQSVDPLLRLLDDKEPAVRVMALRSLARTMAGMPDGQAQKEVTRFAEVICTADLPSGAIEECLLLLEGMAVPVLRHLLGAASPMGRNGAGPDERPALEDARLARAMDAIGRLKVLELEREVAPFCAHPNPEVRAAALRALSSIGVLPPGAEHGVSAALMDPVEFVRVQAARTATLLPRTVAQRAMWDLLGDESWWVRRAAAHSMLGLGTDGPDELERAGRSHPDPYARHMAVQVLLDTGHVDASRAWRIREVG